MTARHVPVRPNLDQLKHQAKDLLRQIWRGDLAAIAELRKYHPEPVEPGDAKLADAQLALARSYGVASWPREGNRLLDLVDVAARVLTTAKRAKQQPTRLHLVR